jgi:glycosyltransferase involved in cell wall biosynthesis
MKICFLASAKSEHIKKWCKWFNENGYETHVVSFICDTISGTKVHYINPNVGAFDEDSRKLRYLLKARQVRKIIENIKPDIVSVHYATSYGTVAALSGMKNYILSIWGSDIYDFPKKSIFHKILLKYSLMKAKYIFSTSKAMEQEARQYTKKNIEITPFGVDMELFNPNKRTRHDNEFVIGTVKTMTYKYGIDYIVKSVSIIKNKYPEIPLKVRIAGDGPQKDEYEQLAIKLGVDKYITWLGFIPPKQVANEWANTDVAVVASVVSESFGVSAIEAQACGVPIIISDVQGLKETTSPNSRYIVPRYSENALADAIVDLYYDSDKRKKMGENGRKFVLENFEYSKCFKYIQDLCEKTVLD